MARVFDKWFMLPSTEIIVFSVAGICSTVMEESVLTIPERLDQVLRFDYSGYELPPFELSAAKSAMCMDVLGRRLAAPVYLLSYFLVVWVAFFGKYPRLLLPWLVIGFFRHIMLNPVSMLTGAYLGARGELTWSLLQFVFVKVFEIMMYAYLWYSVLLLYRGLRLLETLEDVATIVQPPGSPLPRRSESAAQEPPVGKSQVPRRDVVMETPVSVKTMGTQPAPRRSRSMDEGLSELRDDWDDEDVELVGDYKQRAMNYLGLHYPEPPAAPAVPPSRRVICTDLSCDKAVQVNTISKRWLRKLQQQIKDAMDDPTWPRISPRYGRW